MSQSNKTKGDESTNSLPSLSTGTYSGSDTRTSFGSTSKSNAKSEKSDGYDLMGIKEKSTTRDAWQDKENIMTREDLDQDAEESRVIFKPASARMKAGNVDFDEVNDDFMTTDVDTFRDRFKPPHTVDLNDDELQQILDYERKRLVNNDQLLDDRMYEFIVYVAGGTNMNLDRVLPVSTVTNYRGNVGARYNPYRNIRTIAPTTEPTAGGQPFTPPAPVVLGSPVYSRRANLPPPSVPIPPIPSTPVSGGGPSSRPVINPRSTSEMAIRLAEEDRERKSEGNRVRLATGYPWIEKPQVIGQMSLSPKIYFAVKKAFSTIMGVDQLRSFRSIEDFHVLIYTDTTEIRTLFADLTRFYMAHADFFFPTRTPLDKNRDRIYQEIWSCLTELSFFEYLPGENKFRRKILYGQPSRGDLLLKKL